MSVYWFSTSYIAVLAAEIVGDKSFFNVGALATKYAATAISCGLLFAFMAKSLAAVAFGHSLTRIPVGVVSVISALAFMLSAIAIWRDRSRREERSGATAWRKAASVSFSTVFLSEWADLGQIATATIAARSTAPVAVWFGATLALTTKGLIAVSLGALLRRKVAEQQLRLAAVVLCITLGVVTVLRLYR